MNLFDLSSLRPPPGEEAVETLLKRGPVRIERILSAGQASPRGFWYDQEEDEWVCLLEGEAELSFENGERVLLRAGDQRFIPAGTRHRVEKTGVSPPCVWLCVFIARDET